MSFHLQSILIQLFNISAEGRKYETQTRLMRKENCDELREEEEERRKQRKKQEEKEENKSSLQHRSRYASI